MQYERCLTEAAARLSYMTVRAFQPHLGTLICWMHSHHCSKRFQFFCLVQAAGKLPGSKQPSRRGTSLQNPPARASAHSAQTLSHCLLGLPCACRAPLTRALLSRRPTSRPTQRTSRYLWRCIASAGSSKHADRWNSFAGDALPRIGFLQSWELVLRVRTTSVTKCELCSAGL